MLSHGFPELLVINASIIVRKYVALANQIAPSDFGMDSFVSRRDSSGSLTEDFEQPFDSEL